MNSVNALTLWYVRVILVDMKVAVSIPEQVFREAERVQRRLRVPRSQLYARALEAFVKRHSGAEITAKINATLAKIGDQAEPGWDHPGLEVLRRERW